MFSNKMLSLKILVLLCIGHDSATHSGWLYMNKKLKKSLELPIDYTIEYYRTKDLATSINNDFTLYDEINALWEQDALIRQYCGKCLYHNENDYFFVVRTHDTNAIVAVIRFSYNLDERTSCINQIAVHKDHRKHGLGSYLLQIAERIIMLTPCQSVLLYVHSQNKNALSIYKKIGFKVRK